MKQFVCIHAHFYQPPRENPWLEEVEVQDSAYPFHDWNQRITAECYEPNATARILDGRNRITDIVNDYSRISFNFGPTLLSWLERHQPETYQAILAGDLQSRERFGGHGSALAQAFNHLIMPLAHRRDKEAQVVWGIRDFTRRFNRLPEGMWLPETAVDLETLELLAENGISFTLLAPHQATHVRPRGGSDWQTVGEAGIDPRLPYLCPLPSGRSIVLFFYDGAIARDVAFGDLLRDGGRFAHRLLESLPVGREAQLAHIATDGETYGHHHRFGDMALAYCLEQIDSRKDVSLTNYGEYLAQHPPTLEIRVREKSSWSCAHGVGRWRSDCGCRLSDEKGWTQAWRAPLRDALDWLRDRLAGHFEEAAGEMFSEPWEVRKNYIDLLLDRSPAGTEAFLRLHAGRELSEQERVKALRLLEMQRHAMLMFTSCGWFFDEISGIETVQILAYAARALQLAAETSGADLEGEFMRRLEKAPSNLPKWGNGRRVYEGLVKPTQLDLIRVAAHHAIASQFERGPKQEKLYCYFVQSRTFEEIRDGRLKLSVGASRIRSEITGDSGDFSFAVLNLGGHSLNAGICPSPGEQDFTAMAKELRGAFERNEIPEIIRLMDRHFGSHNYSLWHLFRDQQRRILEQIMGRTLEDIEASFQQIYADHLGLMRFLTEIHMPIPDSLRMPVESVINSEFRRLLENPVTDINRLENLAEEAAKLDIRLDVSMLGLTAGKKIGSLLETLEKKPNDPDLLEGTARSVAAILKLPLRPDLRRAQNAFFNLRLRAAAGELPTTGVSSGKWRETFRKLGDLLKVVV